MARLLKSPHTLGILMLLVMGIVRLPVEHQLSHQLREKNLIPTPPDVSLFEALGQAGFATLGGLRSLAASIIYLQAYVNFEQLEWAKVDSLMSLATRLQPQEELYWDDASWHMAYNAASSYLNNTKIRSTIRQKLFREHVQRGIDILNEGLQYLPDNPRLLIKLGDIYNTSAPTSRLPDARKSAEYYLAAYKNGAQPYYERIAAYQLAKLDTPEDLKLAYEILKRHYDRGDITPSMRTVIPEIEEKLKIPVTNRLDMTKKRAPRRFPARNQN